MIIPSNPSTTPIINIVGSLVFDDDAVFALTKILSILGDTDAREGSTVGESDSDGLALGDILGDIVGTDEGVSDGDSVGFLEGI